MARTQLKVFLNDALVGQLEQDDSGKMRFQYARQWLQAPAPVPLSASLPLREERFNPKETRPFFAGVLPEEDSRKLVAGALGVSAANDFALLERIGAECAGAVRLLPSGEAPLTGEAQYREVNSDELAASLSELPRRPLLAGERGIRLSLAGAQGKVAVRIQDGKVSLPLNGAPSSHILKPANPHFEGLVQNEFFCMKLATRAGLDAAGVEIGRAGEIEFLEVKRYDRRESADGHRLERIHQEDFCQALGVPPELKYQQEGGPSLKKCFELIRSTCTAPGPELLRLFDAVTLNYLIGNRDAHGKNFSLLRDEGEIRLAPLYDLVSTEVYPNLSHDMAMKIGGERSPQKVLAKNWGDFFEEAGMARAAAERRLMATSKRIMESAVQLSQQGCAGEERVLEVIRRNYARIQSLRWK